jgi:NAD-dependent histone deacetylase SIR2
LAGQIGFAIEPKKNCPHVKVDWINQLHSTFDLLGGNIAKSKCRDCQDEKENWICMPCGGVFCSRYVNGHMAKHNE